MHEVDYDFFDEGGDGVDEVLDTGPRRPTPSWVPGLVIAIVVIALIVVAIAHGHSTPSAAPSSPVPTVAPSAPAPVVPPQPATASLSEVYSVIADNTNRRLYTLGGEHLYTLRTNGTEQAKSPVLKTGGADDTNDELVFDAMHDIVWVVPQLVGGDAKPGVIEGFDGGSMKLVDRVPLAGPVSSAAVVDGKLYLLVVTTLMVVSPRTSSLATLGTVRASSVSLVPDPARHRLLVVGVGSGRSLGLQVFAHARLTAPVALPFATGQVVVVGSTIWAGGSTAGTAVLTKLDPRTLSAGADLARRVGLGRNAVLDSAGVHSLYVSGTVGGRITCLDGTSGRQLHRFAPTSGTFVSVDGIGFVGSVDALHRVPMGACRG